MLSLVCVERRILGEGQRVEHIVQVWLPLVLPRTLPQLTRRKVERGVDRAVNDPNLEAGIRASKTCCGGHDITIVVEYASAVESAAKRQLDRSPVVLGSYKAETEG